MERVWGDAPYSVVLLHGGPGAAGEMEPVARALSRSFGVLEPLQTADSIDGQVTELREVLIARAGVPVTLAGFSWGAWLAVILASRHPELVRKLVLISTGAFEERYVARLHATRLARLNEAERAEWRSLLAEDVLTTPRLSRLAQFAAKTDSFDPLAEDTAVSLNGEIYSRVWTEAAELRRSGGLLAIARSLNCPVVAMHGDYDPSPAEGVSGPLSPLPDFRMRLLACCGHKPWIERQARDRFYEILLEELSLAAPPPRIGD